MKLELPYFEVEGAHGGSQDWFFDPWMRLGGCAAVTACDCSIYLALYKQKKHLYPYDAQHLTRAEYLKFGKIMKPYLRPRLSGIDRLPIYTEGYGKYAAACGENRLQLGLWEGTNSFTDTCQVVKQQLEAGFPLPCLILKHANPDYKAYVWHWFLLTGYEEFEGTWMVKVVTYGQWRWLNLQELWDTGYARKGGLILFREPDLS